jgi:hypothetical protein
MKKNITNPEIPFADGVPLAPNVSPVILLSGSDYNMGYQYALQLNQIFGCWTLEKLKHNFTEAEIADLKAYHKYLEEFAPEFIDIFRGMAAGAADTGVALSYNEVLADHTLAFGGLPNQNMAFGGVAAFLTEKLESKEERQSESDCSGFAAWGSATKDGRLICAGSGDHDVRAELTIIVLPEKGNNYIFRMSRPSTLSIHPAMNNKGLAYVHHGSGIFGNDQPGIGIPDILSAQHTLRFASNADEALTMQLTYPHGIRAAGLWADGSGKAFNLECRNPLVIRKPGDHGERDFLYVANTCLSRELEPLLKNRFGWDLIYVPHGGWNLDDMNSVRRHLYMWNVLHNYHGALDFESVKMFLRLPSKPPDYPTLKEAEVSLYETKGSGWDTHIGNLANGIVGIMQPDKGDKGLYYACVGPAGRQAEPLSAGKHYYHIAAIHTFIELQLASQPVDIVDAARKRAQYDLYDANRELRRLTYADVAYAPLISILNQAATENQKGEYYLGLIRDHEKDENVCNFAKSVRAFTRCQAYARQVYESIVPPACKPTDLGLGGWFGSWGRWESYPSPAL